MQRRKRNRKFARRVAESGGAGHGLQEEESATCSAGRRRPLRETVQRLSRQLWEFSEQVRLDTIQQAGDGMIVAGIMSGTSADGINVALVKITEPSAAPPARRFRSTQDRSSSSQFENPIRLLGHAAYSLPQSRPRGGAASHERAGTPAWRLGPAEFSAGRTLRRSRTRHPAQFRLKAELVGCHGQTLYHQGEPATLPGPQMAVTWQTGEGAVIAARVGVPVVSDFRPADMAAGGKGAPLVPFLDYLLYRDRRIGRIVQNIGGIANLTAIPAGASRGTSHCLRHRPRQHGDRCGHGSPLRKPYDRDGRIAASGAVLERSFSVMLRRAIFPPQAAQNRRTRRVRTRVRASIRRSCADARARQTSSPRPRR